MDSWLRRGNVSMLFTLRNPWVISVSTFFLFLYDIPSDGWVKKKLKAQDAFTFHSELRMYVYLVCCSRFNSVVEHKPSQMGFLLLHYRIIVQRRVEQ